jgi:hypothetical protein
VRVRAPGAKADAVPSAKDGAAKDAVAKDSGKGTKAAAE